MAKKILKFVAFLLTTTLLVIIFGAWCYHLRPLGNLGIDNARSLFNSSKLSNDPDVNKKELEGVRFFFFFKRFLDTLDEHVVRSVCTTDAHDGENDLKMKGDYLKGVFDEVKKMVFEDGNAKEIIDKILEAKDVGEIVGDKLCDKDDARLMLAKAFIYIVLKERHDSNDLGYIVYRELQNKDVNEYVKGHLGKLTKPELEDISVKVATISGQDKMTVPNHLYLEIYMLSKLLPPILARTTKGVEDLEKKRDAELDEMINNQNQALEDLRKSQEENILKAENSNLSEVEINDLKMKYNDELDSCRKMQTEEQRKLRENYAELIKAATTDATDTKKIKL